MAQFMTADEKAEMSASQPDSMSLKIEMLVLGGIGFLFALICVWLVARGAPLGHDEAVYALKARTLSEGTTSAFFWNDYRAPGLPMILALIGRYVSSDASMRLGVVVFGGLTILLTWLIGRKLFDGQVGLIAAAGLAFSPVVVASASSVWPDLPGTALGLAVLAVLIFSTHRDKVSWWVLVAAPLSIAATLVRFGAPIPIGIGAVAVAVWRWEVVRRSLPQVAALGMLTALPVWAMLGTSRFLGTAMSPLDAIASLDASNDFPFYQGLLDYAKMADFLVLHPSGILLVVGMIFGLITALGKAARDKSFLLSAGVAVVTVLVLALTLHGEYRYLTPAYPWLWISAAVGLSAASRSMSRAYVRSGAIALLVLAIVGGASDGGVEVEKNKERFPDIRTAALQLDDMTADGECGVITGYIPQVAWYSRCITTNYSNSEVRLTSTSFPEDPRLYLLLVQDGKRQPDGAILDGYLAKVAGDCFEVGEPDDGPFRHVRVCPLANS
ncbi:MAG: glycosyltransferase family 39 protein [Acidimicrobiia bacterium]|nr:glycosyltransferase family 39 protein [Acidimicrobiia bacterium]